MPDYRNNAKCRKKFAKKCRKKRESNNQREQMLDNLEREKWA